MYSCNPWDYLKDERIQCDRTSQTTEYYPVLNTCCDYAEKICNESNGIVSKDFPKNVASLIKMLLCYNKKQFYIFVDDKNSNSIRVSSRKQYLILKALLKDSNDDRYIKITKRTFSQEASIVRLIKEAIKYNQYARFLSRVKEKELITFCDAIMKSTSCGFKIIDAPIQDCYNSELPRTNTGSGKRFATSSCMYRKLVGNFYDMFNVKGKMVTKNGIFVGRYLEWKMDNGKTYVDRLYVNGDIVTPALNCIDEYYKDREDVEFYPETPSGIIKMKNGNAKDFDKLVYFPYIDTFSHFSHNTETDDIYLSKDISISPFDEWKNLKSTSYEDNIFQYWSCDACNKKFMTKTALKFHKLFETKTNKGKVYNNNQKIKDIICKYMKEIKHV